MLFGILLGSEAMKSNIDVVTPQVIWLSIVNTSIGAAILLWLLRRSNRERFSIFFLLVAIAILAAAAERWLFPNLPIGEIASGATANVLYFTSYGWRFQAWYGYKSGMFFQRRILHSDICWLFGDAC